MIGSNEREAAAPRPRGRPRLRPLEPALEAAMGVFWRHGYEGASIETLSRETGLNRSSLYGVWGDKRGLFLAALERYAQTRLAPLAAALEGGGTLAADLAAFFEAVADLAVAERRAGGCLISCALADAAGSDADLRAELRRRFDAMEARLLARLSRERTERPEATAGREPPEALAGVLAATARGMMLRARAGAERAEIAEVGAAAARLVAGAATGDRGTETTGGGASRGPA